MFRDSISHNNITRNVLCGLIFTVCLFVLSCGKRNSTHNYDPTTSTTSTDNTTTSIGLFVAVGTTGTILTSPVGRTWTSRTPETLNHLQGNTYANSTFVTVGDNGTILTSSDGTTWTSRTSGTSNDLRGVT